MNINRVVISGRVVKDPEMKKIGEFDLCSMRIASNRIIGKKKTEKSTFIDVDVWGGQAKPCSEFLSKGSRIAVEGRLSQDTWEGKNGEKNSKIYIEADNVMFLDEKGSEKSPSQDKKAPVSRKEPENYDAEIPF